MSFGNHQHDPEDIFAETRMSFGDHIEELRFRLIRALLGFGIGVIVGLAVAWPVLRFIASPVEEALENFYNQRVEKMTKDLNEGTEQTNRLNKLTDQTFQVNRAELAAILGLPQPKGLTEDWVPLTMRVHPLEDAIKMGAAQRALQKPARLATMSIMEGFMVFLKVALVCGVVIGSPWIFYQLWAFVAAGLYPHERRYINVYLPFSLGLFLVGVAVCQFLVIPRAIQYLLSFNEWLGLEPELRLNEWLTFAILCPLIFGISFQTPLVMLFLAKVGIVKVEQFRKKRKIAWISIMVLAMIFAPSPDLFTYGCLVLPIVALYELGIVLAVYMVKPYPLDMEVSETEELVEV